ncbi:MBOAT family O-acyltransferase [Helicobacter saguini]|uniref:MBOAT family O-acyltransferase n=1 Tax=Helicobacter saguini TaxID=1548018 RepID=UPI001F30ECB6|nr:MBOAT family O-acyltransferase [Helicobacter saguini]
MLFNSYQFIFIFLPITFCVYFLLNHYKKYALATGFLAFMSVVFYAWWEYKNVALLLISISFNYFISGLILRAKDSMQISQDSKNLDSKHSQKIKNNRGRLLLIIALIFNISLLCYFKYMDFFIESFNALFHTNIALLHIILPLGISFFTITQIAYLVDCYEGRAVERNIINYALFVTFFPHLIAGPILHHAEMMPQFSQLRNKILKYDNIARGLFIFSIGLFKKVFIADSFAKWANAGYAALDSGVTLNIFESWATSLSYTFQLYFDFSGYCDMAIGLGLLFNIALPINFTSPYKSLNIAEFWRRWHITLGRFLRDYIYIPLGGNRNTSASMLNKILTLRNLFIVAFISGLWHGAGLGFVIWGILHGVAMCIHRIYRYFLESMFDIHLKDSKINVNYLTDSIESKLQDSKMESKINKVGSNLQDSKIDSKENTESNFINPNRPPTTLLSENIESNQTSTALQNNKPKSPKIQSFLESRFYKILCWFITFNFINITWIFFRAEKLDTALTLIKNMFFINAINIESKWWKNSQIFADTRDFRTLIYMLVFALLLVFVCKNSITLLKNFNPQKNALTFSGYLAFIWVLLGYSLYKMLFFQYSEFIYFNF